MKILFEAVVCCHQPYLHGFHNSGILRVVGELIKKLQQADDIELEAFIPSVKLLGQVLDDGHFPERLPGIPLRYSATHYWLYRKLSDFRLYCKQKRVPSSHLGFLYHNTVVYLLKRLIQLRIPDTRLLRDVDIIYYPSPMHAVPPYIRNLKRPKICVMIHDLIPLFLAKNFPDLIPRRRAQRFRSSILSFKEDDCFFCVSESTKKDLCTYRPDLNPDNIVVTPLAADPEVFYPCKDDGRIMQLRRKLKIPEGCKYLLAMAPLSFRKNIGRLVRSFWKVVQQEKIDDLALVLGAPQSSWEDWDAFVECTRIWSDRKNGHKLILTGYIPEEDLSSLYSGAMAFVFPSIYEGFGLPALEAMQCGTPVIASSRSAVAEIVGDAGLKVHPFDEDGLCQCILNVYRSGDLRDELSHRGKERAKQFSWDKHTTALEQGFRRAAAS